MADKININGEVYTVEYSGVRVFAGKHGCYTDFDPAELEDVRPVKYVLVYDSEGCFRRVFTSTEDIRESSDLVIGD